ncbi:MAG: universal stress protein [Ardenticatenaceae bacterium]|nr:universal stress protein [Ardenticatenaceae bacterium]
MSTHTVLIPLDGSEFSRQVLRHVQRFLDPENTELILLRVAPLAEGFVAPPPRRLFTDMVTVPEYESEQAIERAAHPIYRSQVLASLESSLTDELQVETRPLREAGYSVTIAVRFGDPAQEIVEVVDREAVDLVAMATHGRTGFRRIVLGSVADTVLRSVSVPVLLVRPFGYPSGDGPAKRLAEG